MSDTKDNILKIKVEGEQRGIPVESFLELLSDTLSILKDLDANISESENGVLDWEIVEASLNSPMLLSVQSKAEIGNNIGDEVINAYIHGISDLEKGETFIPQYFTPQILHKAQNLATVFTQGITRVSFSTTSGEAVTATKKVFENAAIIIKNNLVVENENDGENIQEVELFLPQAPKPEERATLSGRLETISVHGKEPSFVIYDPLTNTKIDCFFKKEDFEEIQAMFSLKPPRIEVTGKARYGKTGNAISIKVEQFRKLRNQEELPQFGDLEGINLSGDLDPTEYIRRLRNE